MKTLNSHIILYDEECPMCRMYTNAFVKAGMLDNRGRAAYQKMPEHLCPVVDRQRAVNEIALVNEQTGEVSYGVKSLFKIIGQSFPVFAPLFSCGPFVWMMGKLYAFISYNRRVIVPTDQTGERFGLQPTFNKNYRIAYLVFTWFVTSFILSHYTTLMTGLLPVGNGYREYIVCGGQIVFQTIVACLYAREKVWDYLGNMMTISFGGGLLLLLPLLLSAWLPVYPLFFAACFMCVAGLMLLEHIRRTKLLRLGWVLTVSWIVYRLLALMIILKMK